MRIALTLLLLSLTACAAAQREPASWGMPNVDPVKFRHDYLKSFISKTTSPIQDADFQPGQCDHDGGDSCLKIGCSMGSYDCHNFSSQLDKVASMCNGVSGQCVKDTCAVGSYDCRNFSSNLDKVFSLCKDVNPECVKTICGFGSYDCRNFSSQLDKAADLCRGWVKNSCITEMCAMGSYDCRNFSSQLDKVAGLCKNQ